MVLNVIDPNEASSCGSTCGNGLEKVYPSMVARFGFMKYLGEFTYLEGMKFTCGAPVVLQSHRGIEMGEQVSLTCTGCSSSLTRDQIKQYIEASGSSDYPFANGRILRQPTRDDLLENARIIREAKVKLRFCCDLVREMDLPMKPIECEHLFGGERIVFYFTADGRVDFRSLVRRLGEEYHTRIEMRQVGARDEARLLADYETCGRECCCKAYLKTLKPVSMKMAKMQKATLDPTKVSGRCGRLKCCLRYEHESYEELEKRLPRLGKTIRTAHGDGVVVDRQILTQLVQFATSDGRRVTVAIEDVYEDGVAPPAPEPVEETSPSEDPLESGDKGHEGTDERLKGIEDRSQQTGPPDNTPKPRGRRRRGRRRGKRHDGGS